ncbi:hypothetical protein HPB47_020080 [Ixodes persulcatus]|uniref:Uncharacterized protein n=1 Tax=Ixodes persulcatus TaxID=34615 RepID=A0AC60QGE0_IXOPE|nr:hypothetical protein HPB47_020080 [Ixodes persulcatus]
MAASAASPMASVSDALTVSERRAVRRPTVERAGLEPRPDSPAPSVIDRSAVPACFYRGSGDTGAIGRTTFRRRPKARRRVSGRDRLAPHHGGRPITATADTPPGQGNSSAHAGCTRATCVGCELHRARISRTSLGGRSSVLPGCRDWLGLADGSRQSLS